MSSGRCQTSSLPKMSFIIPFVHPLAKGVVPVWQDDVKMYTADTNKKILPVDIRNVSILEV